MACDWAITDLSCARTRNVTYARRGDTTIIACDWAITDLSCARTRNVFFAINRHISQFPFKHFFLAVSKISSFRIVDFTFSKEILLVLLELANQGLVTLSRNGNLPYGAVFVKGNEFDNVSTCIMNCLFIYLFQYIYAGYQIQQGYFLIRSCAYLSPAIKGVVNLPFKL